MGMLACVNANPSPVVAGGLKFNNAVNKSKEGMVSADSYIVARMNACPPLTNQNSPGMHILTSVSFHPKSLGLAIPTVAAGAACLFMRHLPSPLYF